MRIALLVCRWIVGGAFIAYGLVKIFGGQFHQGDFVIDSATTDPTFLVWCFFGYSPAYARFLGLCEFVPGLLLLFPRTRTLGACALLPLTLNITVMDFCFGFPAVKYTSLVLTVLCALLVLSDWRKLAPIVWDPNASESSPRAARDDQSTSIQKGQGSWRNCSRGIAICLAIAMGLFLVNLLGVALGPDPVQAAVRRCVDEGWKESDLTLRGWRRTAGDLGVQMEAVAEFSAATGGRTEQVRVVLQRLCGLTPWRAVRVERIP